LTNFLEVKPKQIHILIEPKAGTPQVTSPDLAAVEFVKYLKIFEANNVAANTSTIAPVTIKLKTTCLFGAMIDSKCAISIALNDTFSNLADWKLVDVTVLRCELMGDRS
jgi:hypothetical protein